LSNILSDLIRRRLVSFAHVLVRCHSSFYSSRSSLPELEVELQNLLKETESQLSKLPANPSDDAQGEVILLVSGLARELATYVDGTPDDHGIHQLIRPLNNTFVTEIRSTAQPFSPFERDTEPFEMYYEGPVQICPKVTGSSPRRSREGRVGVPFTHPGFLTSDVEPQVYNGDVDAICVDEVMEMANG
jgi:hypothetical protein